MYKRQVYGVIVPDKNYFLADKNGYPSMDYDEFYSLMKDKLDFMQLIDAVSYTHLIQDTINSVEEASGMIVDNVNETKSELDLSKKNMDELLRCVKDVYKRQIYIFMEF